MFRLIKLAVYALVGYCLYEMILGMTETPGKNQPESTPAPAPRRRGRVNISGASGQGAPVPIRDNSGVERTQTVGRGVVS